MYKIMIILDEEIFKEWGYPYLKGGYFECTPPFNYIIFKLINKRFASGIIYNKDSQPYGYIQGEFKNGEFIGKWDIREKRILKKFISYKKA